MSAPAAAFCGRCGAALAIGATFCGRCGAAQATPATVSGSPPAPPPAPPASHGKLSHRGLLAAGGGALLVLVAAGVLLTRSVGTPVAKCRFDCGDPRGIPVAEVHTFTSSQFGFQVDYPAYLTVSDQGTDHVTFSDPDPRTQGAPPFATITVTGMAATKSADQLVSDAITALASSQQLQAVQVSTTINGAHIGSDVGVGRIYDANLFSPGVARHVRVVVIAAVHGSTAGVVTAIEEFNGSPHFRSDTADPATFDYMMAEFRWAGQ